MSLAILASWLFWGVRGGIFVTIAFSTLCIVIAAVMGSGTYVNEVFLFTGIVIFCYVLLEREKKVQRQAESQLERIQGSKNTLQYRYKMHSLAGEALESRISRYLMLREVAQVLTSSLDFDKTAGLIVRRTLEIMGKGEICLLYLADVEGQKLALKASWKSKIKSKIGDEFDDWVLKQKQVLLVEDVEKDFRFGGSHAARERKIGSLISAPLISGERAIGILRIDSEKANTFLTDDLRLLNIFAVLAAVSIENAQLYERTEELAITDGLTGLYVHRYFQERLEEELRRAMRSHSFLSFLMFDIDHFKIYNDRYGHSVGDVVLKKVSNIFKEKSGDGGIAARYGGEEFAIILPRVKKEDAIKMAQKIRKAIAEESITIRRKKTNITVSAGVATFPVDAMVKQDIIGKADSALLRAKREGRNKVCVA